MGRMVLSVPEPGLQDCDGWDNGGFILHMLCYQKQDLQDDTGWAG